MEQTKCGKSGGRGGRKGRGREEEEEEGEEERRGRGGRREEERERREENLIPFIGITTFKFLGAPVSIHNIQEETKSVPAQVLRWPPVPSHLHSQQEAAVC